jgi:hypothetical protein
VIEPLLDNDLSWYCENIAADFYSAYHRSSGPGPGPELIVLELPQPLHMYDVRAKRGLGRTDRLALELDPVQPIVLGSERNPLASPSISGPQNVQQGADAEFTIRADAAAGVNVVHVDTIGPDGKTVAHYSGNPLVTAGNATKLVLFALNDQPGRWMIRANLY